MCVSFDSFLRMYDVIHGCAVERMVFILLGMASSDDFGWPAVVQLLVFIYSGIQ